MTSFRRLEASAPTEKKALSDLRFDSTDKSAQARLALAQYLGCPRQIADPGELDKSANCASVTGA